MKEGGDPRPVSKWLADRIPGNDGEVLLLWDHRTAAIVPRDLFIERWSDFWYPSSDDLTVMGNIGEWRVEMYHHGMFDFFAGGGGELDGIRPVLA